MPRKTARVAEILVDAGGGYCRRSGLGNVHPGRLAMAFKPFPQRLFVEFADAGFGYFVDEHHVVRQPPAGEIGLDEVQDYIAS